MEANLFGILFEQDKLIYLPRKQIIVPFIYLGSVRGSDIGLERPFEEFDFIYYKLLTGEELVVGRSAPGFSVGATLAQMLKNDAADNRILAIRPDDTIDLLQVYDIDPRTPELKDYCFYGDLVRKINERAVSSRA